MNTPQILIVVAAALSIVAGAAFSVVASSEKPSSPAQSDLADDLQIHSRTFSDGRSFKAIIVIKDKVTGKEYIGVEGFGVVPK